MLDSEKLAFSHSIRKAFVLRGRSEQSVGAILLGAWWEQLQPYSFDDVNQALSSVAINETLQLSAGHVIQKIKILVDARKREERLTESRCDNLPYFQPPPQPGDGLPCSVAELQSPHVGEIPCFPAQCYGEDAVVAAGDFFLNQIRTLKRQGSSGRDIADRMLATMARHTHLPQDAF